METEKQKEADALEKELKRMLRKLDSENDALNKILENTGPGMTKKKSGRGSPMPGNKKTKGFSDNSK
jgi:hypothetical protein